MDIYNFYKSDAKFTAEEKSDAKFIIRLFNGNQKLLKRTNYGDLLLTDGGILVGGMGINRELFPSLKNNKVIYLQEIIDE